MRMSHVWHSFILCYQIQVLRFKKVRIVKSFLDFKEGYFNIISLVNKLNWNKTNRQTNSQRQLDNELCDLTWSRRHKKTSYQLDSQTEIICVLWSTKITFKNVICLPKGILFVSSVGYCLVCRTSFESAKFSPSSGMSFVRSSATKLVRQQFLCKVFIDFL